VLPLGQLFFATYDEAKCTGHKVKDLGADAKGKLLEAGSKVVNAKLGPSPSQRLVANLIKSKARQYFQAHPVGSTLYAMDCEGQWFEAVVKATDLAKHQFRVNFKGWPASHDEWVDVLGPKHSDSRPHVDSFELPPSASKPLPRISQAPPKPEKPKPSKQVRVSGFMLFCNTHRAAAKEVSQTPQEVMKKLGGMWGELSSEQKSTWNQQALGTAKAGVNTAESKTKAALAEAAAKAARAATAVEEEQSATGENKVEGAQDTPGELSLVHDVLCEVLCEVVCDVMLLLVCVHLIVID
jgi:hypothetical protein